jgi:hypothetical protein
MAENVEGVDSSPYVNESGGDDYDDFISFFRIL